MVDADTIVTYIFGPGMALNMQKLLLLGTCQLDSHNGTLVVRIFAFSPMYRKNLQGIFVMSESN